MGRVSTPNSTWETQLYDLRQLRPQRGFQSSLSTPTRRLRRKGSAAGLDTLMADARKHTFSVVSVTAFDFAMSTKHFLSVVNELGSLGIEFVSCGRTWTAAALWGLLHRPSWGSSEAEKSIFGRAHKKRHASEQSRWPALGRQRSPLTIAAIVEIAGTACRLTQLCKTVLNLASVSDPVRARRQRRESELRAGKSADSEQTSAVACIA